LQDVVGVGGFSKERFAELHPRLYHMAADGAWAAIQEYGLLSATAILDMAGLDAAARIPLERQRRMDSVAVDVDGHRFVLRDQKPLNEAKLEACLTDMTVPEWIQMLNRKVFFWPTESRCRDLIGARAYRDQWHTVIEVDTAGLLERHEVRLSPINAGAVLYSPPHRGSHTFTSIADFPFDDYRTKRSRNRVVAEVAVDCAVPEITAITTRVWRARRSEWVPQ
jgi:hypothetical protein